MLIQKPEPEGVCPRKNCATGRRGIRPFTEHGVKGRLLHLLAALIVMPALAFPFGDHEAFDTWQRRFLLSGSDAAVLDVPYVQTEDYIVDRMLGLLDLKAGDVLYDLGCGDGRIVIAAAGKPGVRGVGIDIDPQRIAESKANALSAGVADRTLFLRQDLFASPISDATAVTLFLLPEINLMLRPKLFRELRPGTRIVSHNFDMGEWKPDRSLYVGFWADGRHYLHFWVLPANAGGTWQGPAGQSSWSLFLRQRFQRIEGALSTSDGKSLTISEGTLSGEKIRFTAVDGASKQSLTFDGTVKGDVIDGAFSEAGKPQRAWRATRDGGASLRIE